MRHLFIGAGLRRRWRPWAAGIILVGAVVGLVYLFLSDQSGPRLELVALGADGGYSPVAEIPNEWADTTADRTEVAVRVPLVVGLRNVGGEGARPGRLSLSVPLQFRLRARTGGRLSRHLSSDGPLVEYRATSPLPEVPPSGASGRAVVWDTLSLDVVVPAFHCVAMADSVPTFMPAPPVPVEPLADVRMFYSLSGGDLPRRQTGLLRVRIDPSLIRRPDADSMETFPTEVHDPEAPFPALDALRFVGSRRALCGEPAEPMEFLTLLWETTDGGRFFVIHYGGVPRKYLFDLDGDGVLELEMGDPDGDGRFESRSRMRMRVPRFLVPQAPDAPYDPSTLDSLPDDRRIALDVFRDAMRGPYRPIGRPPEATPDPGIFPSGRMPLARDDRSEPRPGDVRPTMPRADRRPPPVLGEPAAPDDAPARPREPDAERQPGTPVPQPPTPDQRPEEEPESEDEGPRLLGVPVDSVDSGTPPDTTGGG